MEAKSVLQQGMPTKQRAKDLNNKKNRTDQPGDGDYVGIGWDDLKNLPSDRVDDFQGAPVRVGLGSLPGGIV